MKKTVTLLVLFSIVVGKIESAYSQCAPSTYSQNIDINNVRARINIGDMWWDLNNSAKYQVPKNDGISSLFAGALWIGGLDDQGALHVAAQTYRQNGNDFYPGPLDNNCETTNQTCSDFDFIWKINQSTIDSFQLLFAGHVPGDGFSVWNSQVPPTIMYWPAFNNPFSTIVGSRHLAPFFDYDFDGNYNPTMGDYPVIKGDQALWMVFNDKGNTHNETGGQAFGIEIHLMVYAFQSADVLNTTTFYEYTIFNKCQINYNKVYLGIWTDPDLGCYVDDYIGCDTIHDIGILYNADTLDQNCPLGYGTQPPMQSIKVLEVTADSFSSPNNMTNFMYYNNDFTVNGNPENALDYYNYLKSIWKDGSHLTEGGIGFGGNVSTDYAFSGNPSDTGAWSECAMNNIAADRRMIVASGPMDLNAGSMLRTTYAAIWTRPDLEYPCPSFDSVAFQATYVQAVFDNYILTSSVSHSFFNEKIKLYPNPATNEIIVAGKYSSQLKFSVLNVLGQEIKIPFTKTDSTINLNVSSLVPGFYSIVIHDRSKLFTGKFIKE